MKEKFCNADMNGSRKSDNNIVPEKPANKEGKISAEQVEGRALTEGNIVAPAAVRTQGRGAVSIGLQGVRRKAQLDKDVRFNNLFHHITPDLLIKSFHGLKKNAAKFLKDLTERMGKFGLELHPDKTRLIEFGRFADANRRKTIKKRFVKKYKEVKQELKERMHDDVKETGKRFLEI